MEVARVWRPEFQGRNDRIFFVLCLALLCAGPFTARAGDGDHPDATRRRIYVPVLMYHYISVPPPDADKYRLDLSVTPEQFAEQMLWLRDHGYTAITFDALYNALTWGDPLPERPVLLTFDDGYADAYTHAFPIMQQTGMVGTFFVVTEWVDLKRDGYLTWDQAREMAAAGHAIQSHTRTHPDLTDGCDLDCLIWQIRGPIETIEAEIGVRPRFFCYPSGRYDEVVLAMLQVEGVVAAVTTNPGTLHFSERPLELPRVRVRGATTITEFAWLVAQWRE
jgi:peptidoglycan/xylan/chitin deacetylase (PgdA/CDA1 family)